MASNSLHLTTMCLQYRPTVVACFCIHLASKWSNWAIPQSSEGRHWFSYVDRSVTAELLERLTAEFLHIFDKCPSRLKKKMKTMSNNSGSSPHSAPGSSSGGPFDKKHVMPSSDDFDKSFDREYEREKRRQPMPGGYVPAAGAQPTKIDHNAYREKREREERERQRQAAARAPPRPPAPPPRAPHKPPPSWPPQHHAKHQHHKPSAHPDHRHHRPPFPAPQEVPQRTRPPSLFSPENATAPAVAATSSVPQRRPQEQRPAPRPPHRPKEPPPAPAPDARVRDMQPPAILSPFSSPPPKEHKPRQRQPSNSEPELVPVVKKLDETPGYENLLRDSQRSSQVRRPPEQKRPEPTIPPPRPLNGIETDPTLVSNLLKESLAKPAPITVQVEKRSPEEVKREVKREPVIEPPPVVVPPVVVDPPPAPAAPPADEAEHRHKKEKKKKEKHKHKDRDKSKEERKKHKKDKEKKPEAPAQPPAEPTNDTLRITIPRDKLASSPAQGLKIKIPKERLAVQPPPPPQQTSGLKIKISKDVLDSSRKRSALPDNGPPMKMQRQNGAPHPHKVEPQLGNGHSAK
ncbi:hypothetical protein JYU34_001069 [Plutella xylostella]|uniref:Cyclin-T n=1 Tax=Plutella xylostella TaxID=51655 RepID=A0ABQ7R5X2_PLUXY|nr:hypothetical protein JYU34_001069 [Plutella xylostella]